MPTAKEVLNKIDNNTSPFGMAFVEPHIKLSYQEEQLRILQRLEKRKKENKKS